MKIVSEKETYLVEIFFFFFLYKIKADTLNIS